MMSIIEFFFKGAICIAMAAFGAVCTTVAAVAITNGAANPLLWAVIGAGIPFLIWYILNY
jgi:hypothetical protein